MTLRGSRIGGPSSFESDRDEAAPRRLVDYACQAGHRTVVPFAAEATELPDAWDCPRCGRSAQRGREGDAAVTSIARAPEPERKPTSKTHWEQVLSRRSTAELASILDERLAQLAARRGEA